MRINETGLIDKYLKVKIMERKSWDNTMSIGLKDKAKADRYRVEGSSKVTMNCRMSKQCPKTTLGDYTIRSK
jgi:hypothetical protein